MNVVTHNFDKLSKNIYLFKKFLKNQKNKSQSINNITTLVWEE